jgi:hypothetical protein
VETPSVLASDGVVVSNVRESEWRIVVRRISRRIGVYDVVEGSILVEAMDLSAVAGFEEVKELMEEVVNLDDCLVGDGWQTDLDRKRIGSHKRLLSVPTPHGAA